MKNNHISQADIEQIINKIHFHSKKRLEMFLYFSPNIQANILLHLTKHIQRDIVNRLSDNELLVILDYVDPDKATDILQLLKEDRQKLIIPKLNEELRSSVQVLSTFDPQTAAGLMNINYIQVDIESLISTVAARYKAHEQRTGKSPVIIVTKDGKVHGNLPGHALGFALPDENIEQYVTHISTIRHNAKYNDVVHTFKAHPHNKVVVLNDRKNVIGIIYTDDVLRVIGDQTAASLYDFAGVNNEESVADSAKRKVQNRYKWLIINLGTAFLAAFTVSQFRDTLSEFVLLAVYMPIVAGMGGNAATQTLAVLVRGISLKQISFSTAWTTLKNEVGAGLINGIINGILVAIVVLVVNQDVRLAIVISFAMIINLLVAAFFGTLIPLVMQKLGKDPATSATIFISTATDVLGFLVFLGLATLILV